MKALFKHGDGRLKTSRIALLVFLVLLVCLSLVYKMGKSADKVLVKIEHVFNVQKKEDKKEPVAVVNESLEYPIPREKSEIQPNEEQTSLKTGKQASSKIEKQNEEQTEKFVQKQDPKKKTKQEEDPRKKTKQEEESRADNKLLSKVMSEDVSNNTSIENKTIEKPLMNKPIIPEKDPVSDTLSQNLKVDLNKETIKIKNEKPGTLDLSSKEYFEIYTQWKQQGETMDKNKALVGLRILHLEKVYDLFQMKAVVLKAGVPHTDLEDNSRIAKASLSEFSSTCFIVTHPWKKWGHVLRDAGFKEKDNIEVRYYTYEFVRNSIYARALKAFEWSVEKQNLSKDTDPSQADVLGVVYAVNKDGGGSFGVFVPTRVDFESKVSVDVNPLACFKGQKDIEALKKAGVL